MTANSDIYYRFWVYGGTEGLTGEERRLYEAERMEYDDIVDMPDETIFDQSAIVNWVSCLHSLLPRHVFCSARSYYYYFFFGFVVVSNLG